MGTADFVQSFHYIMIHKHILWFYMSSLPTEITTHCITTRSNSFMKYCTWIFRLSPFVWGLRSNCPAIWSRTVVRMHITTLNQVKNIHWSNASRCKIFIMKVCLKAGSKWLSLSLTVEKERYESLSNRIISTIYGYNVIWCFLTF